MAKEILRPDEDVDTDWATTGTDHYTEIDEAVANDADYIYIRDTDYGERFYLYLKPPTEGTSTYYEHKTITDTWALVSHQWTVNPETSSAWTIADFTAQEFPIRFGVSAGERWALDSFIFPDTAIPAGSTINSVTLYARIKYILTEPDYGYYCSQLYIEIDYTEAATGTHKNKVIYIT